MSSLFQKSVLSVLALFSLSMTQSTTAIAGTGRNGPDLAGISIPVAVERGVEFRQIRKAVNVCLVTGDAARGLVSVTQRVGQLLYPNEAISSQIRFPGAETEIANGFFAAGQVVSYPRNTYERFTMTHVLEPTLEHGLMGGLVFTITVEPVQQESVDTRTFLEAKTFLPFVAWKKLISHTTYDRLGNASHLSDILQGVTIQVPKGYAQGQTMMSFSNPATPNSHGENILQINLKEYVQCLQGEIQR